jgi:hypothetical protein
VALQEIEFAREPSPKVNPGRSGDARLRLPVFADGGIYKLLELESLVPASDLPVTSRQ